MRYFLSPNFWQLIAVIHIMFQYSHAATEINNSDKIAALLSGLGAESLTGEVLELINFETWKSGGCQYFSDAQCFSFFFFFFSKKHGIKYLGKRVWLSQGNSCGLGKFIYLYFCIIVLLLRQPFDRYNSVTLLDWKKTIVFISCSVLNRWFNICSLINKQSAHCWVFFSVITQP